LIWDPSPLKFKKWFKAWTPAFAGVTLTSVLLAAQPKSIPSPSPSPSPQRYRIGDIPDEPRTLERIEQSLVTLLGLGLFFWAPNARLSYRSNDGNSRLDVRK